MPDDSSSNRAEPWISFDMFQLGKRTKHKAEKHWRKLTYHHTGVWHYCHNRMLCGFQRNITALFMFYPTNYKQCTHYIFADHFSEDRVVLRLQLKTDFRRKKRKKRLDAKSRLQYPRFKWLLPNSTAFTAVLSENPTWKKHEKQTWMSLKGTMWIWSLLAL